MNKEKLIALGLSEEVVETVLKYHKEAIDGNYVPKATFDAERENSKTLKDQVEERDKQILELGKFKGTAEELSTKVKELETQNSEQKATYEKQMADAQRDMILKNEISPLVNNVSDILPKLDMEKIVIKDGKVEGLTEQIETIKKDSPYYFKEQKTPDQTKKDGWVFGKPPAEGSDHSTETKSPDSAFGANLAKSKLEDSSISKKFEENYFK